MTDWLDVTRDLARSFVDEITSREAPPMYQFAVPSEVNRQAGHLRKFESAVSLNPRADSGTIEILRGEVEAADAIFAIAASVDLMKRQFDPEPFPESSPVQSGYRTRLYPADVDTVGPGGRVLVYRHGPVLADVVIRRRIDERVTGWRPWTDIKQDMVSATFGADHVLAKYGYLELSKYERQEWELPVLLLIVEGLLKEGDPEWRRSEMVPLALPYYDDPGIAPQTVFGSWA